MRIKPIKYGSHFIEEDDIQAMVEVMHSAFITQGGKAAEFEKVLAERCRAHYAVAVNSGTSALHIACLALGLKEGQEGITSPNTFVASANCIAYCGAHPRFVDIEERTYNLSPDKLRKAINEKTRVIIPVHFAGQSCDMTHIRQVVDEAKDRYGNKIHIIEDACHALGSKYRDTLVGSCTYSDMAVFSFHPVKHITTGEGGAVLTNDEELYSRLKRFRTHGITYSADEFDYPEEAFESTDVSGAKKIKPWYYEQQDLGYNFRITDIQCALGLSQLNKLDRFASRRREIVDRYNQAFQGLQYMQTPFEADYARSNFHLYVPQFDFDAMGTTRVDFMARLVDQGIHTQVHYIPVHTQPFYRERFSSSPGDFPQAEAYYHRCLTLPLFHSMTDEEVEWVIESIRKLVAS